MTLDAMDWVWRHSRTRGNARLALLYVADQVRTPDCEVRLSTSDFMEALNVTSRGTASAAVKAARASGDLELLEEGRGSRSALYRLPKAVGYRRGATPAVPDSGTQSVPNPGTQGAKSVPDSGTPAQSQDRSSVPDLGTVRSEIQNASVPDFAPLYPSHPSQGDGAIDASANPTAPDDGIPAFARPLVDSCTLAGVLVRWPFQPAEWLRLHAAIKKSGTPALAAYAEGVWQRQRGAIDSARYFLRGWTELPPLPSAEAERPPLRALPPAAAGPVDPKLAARQAGRNLLDQLSEQLRQQRIAEEGHSA